MTLSGGNGFGGHDCEAIVDVALFLGIAADQVDSTIGEDVVVELRGRR